MEAVKQQNVVEASSGQRVRISRPRLIFIGSMALAAIYVVWGIAKVIL